MLRGSLRKSTGVRPNFALRHLSKKVKVERSLSTSDASVRDKLFGAEKKSADASYELPNPHMPGAGLPPKTGTMEAMDGNTAAVHVACKYNFFWGLFLVLFWNPFFFATILD